MLLSKALAVVAALLTTTVNGMSPSFSDQLMHEWLTSSDVAYNFTRINKNDTVLLIVDHQEGLFQLVRDFQPDQYRRAVLAHASIGKIFNLPVIMTSSSDTGALFFHRYRISVGSLDR